MKRIALCCALVALGCSSAPPAVSAESAALISVGYTLASSPDGFEPDGIAADQRLVFTCQVPSSPSAGAVPTVRAFSRLFGAQVGQLPAPTATGWNGPTGVEVLDFTTSDLATSGTLLVFDNGGLPPAPTTKFVAKYSYSYSPTAGFSATMLNQWFLPTQNMPFYPATGFGFISDLRTLPDGKHVLTDPFLGDIWLCDASFSCQPVMYDADFAPAPAPTFTGTGRAPSGGTRMYQLGLSVGLSPGVVGAAYVAVTDEVCVGRTAQPGGLWCIKKSVLEDTTADPFAKTKRVLQAPAVGVSDGGHGVAADSWHSGSPWVYWIRSYSDPYPTGVNSAFRVNALTGAVETILASNDLLDFGTGISVMPPLPFGAPGVASLAIPNGQEENNGLLNTFLGGVDAFVSPTTITGVKVNAY